MAECPQSLLLQPPSAPVREPPAWSLATRDSDAPFHSVAHLGPDTTFVALCDRLAKVVLDVFEQRGARVAIDPKRITHWHRSVFGRHFAADAGRFRKPWEDTWFGVWVETPDGWIQQPVQGAPPHEIAERLQRACQPFTGAARENIARDDAFASAADLLAEIVRIHPFVDGNLRTAVVAMQAALHFASLPAVPVVFGDLGLARGLGWALRPDALRSSQPLAAALQASADLADARYAGTVSARAGRVTAA